MMKKATLIISLILFTFSCKNSNNYLTNKERDAMNNKIWEVKSKSKIDENLKLADAPYILDYEVKVIKPNNINYIKFQKLINNSNNFESSEAISQCKSTPEYFIQLDEKVYGLNLSSECPTLFIVSYDGPKETSITKDIKSSRKKKFMKTLNINKNEK